MITGMEIAACHTMAVPAAVMQHIVNIESGYNPYAIGVVGGQLVRQPQTLAEAVATAQMLETQGYNFSLGLSQVNRANLSKYGLNTYEQAFDICPNLNAGARILSSCYASSGNDWGKSFSCYYSGNFVTGYRDGYVQKIYSAISAANAPKVAATAANMGPIELAKEPLPLLMHGATRSVLPTLTSDTYGYRMNLRSTPLDTTQASYPISADRALAQVPASPVLTAAATLPSPNVRASADEPLMQQTTLPSTSMAGAVKPDVFEPQVTVLGDPTVPGASVATKLAPSKDPALSGPSILPADRADLSQGGHDNAFVF